MEYVYKNLQTAAAIQCEHIKVIEKFEDIIAEKLEGTINLKELGFDKIQEKTRLRYIVVRSIEVTIKNHIEQQEYVILELVD